MIDSSNLLDEFASTFKEWHYLAGGSSLGFAIGLGVAVVALVHLADDSSDDEETSEIELPTVCRVCDERTRMQGNFRCPTCHSGTTPEDYDGRMADD